MVECSICGKLFRTAQALGGHKGSHSRDSEDYLRRRREGQDRKACAHCGIETTNRRYCSQECNWAGLRTQEVYAKDGVLLDITKDELAEYRVTHPVCEICGKTESKMNPFTESNYALCADHDHNSNKFRGLLCSVCNRQLGWFENNQSAIIEYLAR
jgi:hypothetical protein